MPLCDDRPIRGCRCDDCYEYFKWGTGKWAAILQYRRQRPQSTRDMIVGDGRNGGYHYSSGGGVTYTEGDTKDPRYPGGRYRTTLRPDGGKKTDVFDSDGNLRETKTNSKW